jgi:hypothetical protein
MDGDVTGTSMLAMRSAACHGIEPGMLERGPGVHAGERQRVRDADRFALRRARDGEQQGGIVRGG